MPEAKKKTESDALLAIADAIVENLQYVQESDVRRHLRNEYISLLSRAAELGPEGKALVDANREEAFKTVFQQGGEAFNRRDYEDAVYFFETASLLKPHLTQPYANQAYSLINAGRLEEAIEPFEKAVELGDTEADTYIFLSDLYTTFNRARDAVTLLERARDQFPDNTEIQGRLLNAYVEAGQADRAMEKYRESVEQEPDNKLYRYNYGSLLLQAERYDEAIEQLQEAVRLDPSYGSAYYNLGASYINKAVGVNERAGELDDELRAQRWQLSEAEIRQREAEIEQLLEERRSLYEQAIEPLEQARQLLEAEGGEVQQVCQALFAAYAQNGQLDKAEAIAECAGYGELIEPVWERA